MDVERLWELVENPIVDPNYAANIALSKCYLIKNEYAYKEDGDIHYIYDDILVKHVLDSYKDEDGYLHKNDYLINDHADYEPEVKYLKPELAICECCGAPLHGDKCEYCGSTYIWR